MGGERKRAAAGAHPPWYRSSSTWVAAACVAVAAGLAWYGTGGTWGAEATNRPTETLSAQASPADPQVVGSLFIGGLPTRVVVAKVGIDAAISEVGVLREGGRAVWE